MQTDLTAQQLQAYMEAAEQWRTKAIQAEQDAARARAALVTAESSQRVSPTKPRKPKRPLRLLAGARWPRREQMQQR